MTNELNELYQRDLDKLENELSLFQEEENIWKTTGHVKNSTGTLILHITGNIQHFFGAVLGNSGYVRDREFEFSGKPVSVDQLHQEIEKARVALNQVLPGLTQADLTAEYPVNVFGEGWSTGKFIIHLFGHLNWHLGHVNYLRRILEKPAKP